MVTYSQYLASIFGPGKYQKLALNAGHDCPNRNGTLGTGGCIYCANTAFSPAYCHDGASIKEQLEAGRKFFQRKYRDMRWLPYFQTFTSTNADLDTLSNQFLSVVEEEDVAGLIVSTRPDCLSPDVVTLLSSLGKPVIVEIGAESSHDRTLQRLNRHHTWQQTIDAVTRAAEAGMHVGLHLIAGLPGETDSDLLATIDRCCKLPLESLKLHHLQILRNTLLHRLVEEGKITVPQLSLQHYLDLCAEIFHRVPESIIIERFVAQAPDDLIVSPRWGLKNYQFMNLLLQRLKQS